MIQGQEKTPNLTPKQAKYAEAVIVKGMQKNEAVEYAGYAEGTPSSHVEMSGKLENGIKQALTKQGVTDEFVAIKILEGMKADVMHLCSFKGQFGQERTSDDHVTREKMVRNYLELSGYIKNAGNVNLDIGLIQLPAKDRSGRWSGVELEAVDNPVDNIVDKSSK